MHISSSYLLAALSLALLPVPTHAVTWYFLRYYTPSSSVSFTSLSGQLAVPAPPGVAGGTYYLWPGLQPTDNSGVYQNVVDGRSGTWWVGSGWCCSNPSLPWGGGFNCYEGESVGFDNVLVEGEGVWRSTLTPAGGGASVTNDFALADKSFNQVLFAIELYDVPWDFGPLAFSDVMITSTGTDSSWCNDSPENYAGATVYSISGVSASVSGDVVTCTIASIVLEGPA